MSSSKCNYHDDRDALYRCESYTCERVLCEECTRKLLKTGGMYQESLKLCPECYYDFKLKETNISFKSLIFGLFLIIFSPLFYLNLEKTTAEFANNQNMFILTLFVIGLLILSGLILVLTILYSLFIGNPRKSRRIKRERKEFLQSIS